MLYLPDKSLAVYFLAMKTFFIILSLFVLGLFDVAAQTMLTIERNFPLPSDDVVMSRADVKGAGVKGKNAVWDFSSAKVIGTKHNIKYYGEAPDSLVRIEDNAVYTEALVAGKLYVYGIEDRLRKLAFSVPVLSVPYPFAYGDSLYAPFEGRGKYCDNRYVKVTGDVKVVADGLGRLALPGNVAFDDVLRVTTTRRADIRMSPDSSAFDSVKPLTEVEHRHDWYASGSRYPLLTLVGRTTYDGQARVAGRKAAYLMTAEDDAAVYDMADENIETDGADGRISKGVLADYDVSFTEGRLTVEYELTDEADVSLSVSDVSGIIYKYVESLRQPAGGHMADISCADLRRGEYVISISVNGKAVGVKFNVK